MDTRLSIVVPTHNRAGSLRRTLAALAGQSLPRECYEVLVVDDGSDEREREQVREVVALPGFTLIEKPQGGLASARNAGAARARGEILYFLDDDVVPAPDAAEWHLRAHDRGGGPVAVVGALPYPSGVRLTPFLWYLERCTHFDLYKDPSKYPGGRPPLPPLNGNSSVPREAFFRVGGYDEGFRRYGGEDLELGHRLARAGVRFVYEPHAIGYHHHLKDFPRFCQDMEQAGESLIRVYRRHPEIRVTKKIDIVEDRFGALPWNKKLTKAVMQASLEFPGVLALPRAAIRAGERFWALRGVLFPLYRWVAHTHYARGMRRGLRATGG